MNNRRLRTPEGAWYRDYKGYSSLGNHSTIGQSGNFLLSHRDRKELSHVTQLRRRERQKEIMKKNKDSYLHDVENDFVSEMDAKQSVEKACDGFLSSEYCRPVPQHKTNTTSNDYSVAADNECYNTRRRLEMDRSQLRPRDINRMRGQESNRNQSLQSHACTEWETDWKPTTDIFHSANDIQTRNSKSKDDFAENTLHFDEKSNLQDSIKTSQGRSCNAFGDELYCNDFIGMPMISTKGRNWHSSIFDSKNSTEWDSAHRLTNEELTPRRNGKYKNNNSVSTYNPSFLQSGCVSKRSHYANENVFDMANDKNSVQPSLHRSTFDDTSNGKEEPNESFSKTNVETEMFVEESVCGENGWVWQGDVLSRPAIMMIRVSRNNGENIRPMGNWCLRLAHGTVDGQFVGLADKVADFGWGTDRYDDACVVLKFSSLGQAQRFYDIDRQLKQPDFPSSSSTCDVFSLQMCRDRVPFHKYKTFLYSEIFLKNGLSQSSLLEYDKGYCQPLVHLIQEEGFTALPYVVFSVKTGTDRQMQRHHYFGNKLLVTLHLFESIHGVEALRRVGGYKELRKRHDKMAIEKCSVFTVNTVPCP